MIDRSAGWVAEAAGGRLAAGDPSAPGPEHAVIDSREAGPGDLFVGLPGERVDGGEFAADALRAARTIARGRLHVVFGAGGDRDTSKRPLMGRVASELADRAIVTSDNPRSEDPSAIVDQVFAGTVGDAEREVDRRRAIALAVEGAEPGDVVVIAGKGHEQGQEFEGGRKEPFDDVTVAREALRRVTR